MSSRRIQRGAGLIEPLIAIAILSVGILGLAQFQFGMLAQTTDAQSRMAAAGFSDELLTQMRVDPVNVNCYTIPQEGACTSPVALAQATAWDARARRELPGYLSATAQREGDFQFVVNMQWTSKAFTEPRTLEVRTDVRP